MSYEVKRLAISKEFERRHALELAKGRKASTKVHGLPFPNGHCMTCSEDMGARTVDEEDKLVKSTTPITNQIRTQYFGIRTEALFLMHRTSIVFTVNKVPA